MKYICKLFLLLLLPLSSCFWGSEFEEEHITGKYYTSGYEHWQQPMSAVYLYFKETDDEVSEALIPEMLEAVGANERYVVLKGFGEDHYYIARVVSGADRNTARKNILGPLDKSTFYQKLQQMNGDTALRFTHHYQML
ncbi:hypothetical protein [Hymenobacter cellulosivorans]|uniref:SPOR domain-containing protein n=1 Tax=Hymenobacter cellulosivorans TaxID=2932249 RepID=A0ABY4FEJ1_9BACT|nr:hypothetical protein [Hymenobacter cellulosivorans]UOQ54423.1 hypothetical protein MUN80_06595 [Hymenobacter cellulosivorans]